MAKILVIDDQENFLNLIAHLLVFRRYDVTVEKDGRKALERLSAEPFDLVICDICMQPLGGIDVLRAIRERHAALPVVMLTGFGSVETARESQSLGAYDYITKPFEMADMLWTVERALGKPVAAEAGTAGPMPAPQIQYGAGDLVVHSAAMKATAGLLRRLAPTDQPLLISGQPGVGKRHVARVAHVLSGRPTNAFYALDCADMDGESKPGRQADAHGPAGSLDYTLCLVQVERLPMSFQIDLLHLMNPRPPARGGPRIIATTTIDLAQAAAAGLVHRKLAECLLPGAVSVPALRDRCEDVLPLAYDLMRQRLGAAAALPAMDADVRAGLEQHAWPGNVCELRAVVDLLLAGSSGAAITCDRLPPYLCKRPAPGAVPAGAGVRGDGRGRWLMRFLNEHGVDLAEAVPARA